MKKYWLHITLIIIGIFILTYTLGEKGLLGGILGALGIGSSVALQKLKKQAQQLDEEANVIKEEIKNIDKKLDKTPKDLTPEEETEYWKNQ
jgi:hypothetical protein